MSDYCEKCGAPIVEGLTMGACGEEEYCPDCGNIIDECDYEYEEEEKKLDNEIKDLQLRIIDTIRRPE